MSFDSFTPLVVYPANGTADTFAIPDKFYDADDVHVYTIDAAGAETPMDQGTHYSVTITSTDPTPPSRKNGNVVFVAAPADGLDVVVLLWPSSDQDQPFEGRPVTPRQNERVHDRHSMRDAALREFFFRGFRAPLNTTPGLRYIVVGAENTIPIFDATGNLIQGPTLGNVTAVAAISDSVIAVAAIDADVSTVAGIAANVTTVAGIAANVTTVAAITVEVTATATISAEIVSLAAIAADVSSVAASLNGTGDIELGDNKRVILSANAAGAGSITRLVTLNATDEYDRPSVSWLDEAARHRVSIAYHTRDITSGNYHEALEFKTSDDPLGGTPAAMLTRLSIGTDAALVPVEVNAASLFSVRNATDNMFLVDADGVGDLAIGDGSNTSVKATIGGRGIFGYDSVGGAAVVQGKSGKGIAFCVNNDVFTSGKVWSITSAGRLDMADVVTGRYNILGTDDVARWSELSGRSFSGYDSVGGNVVLQGKSGKGISFCVNNDVFASGEVLKIGPTGVVTLADAVNGEVAILGTDDVARNLEISGRARIGYDSVGGNVVVQGQLAKGISFCVNNDTFAAGEAWSIEADGELRSADALTAVVMTLGQDNLARSINFAGTRAGVGYNGATVEMRGGPSKGASIFVNNSSEVLRADPTNLNIGMGTTAPNAKAKLDLTSTTQGFLPPRMTTTQRDAITTPPAGLMIYNTTTNKLNVYTTAWEQITSS